MVNPLTVSSSPMRQKQGLDAVRDVAELACRHYSLQPGARFNRLVIGEKIEKVCDDPQIRHILSGKAKRLTGEGKGCEGVTLVGQKRPRHGEAHTVRINAACQEERHRLGFWRHAIPRFLAASRMAISSAPVSEMPESFAMRSNNLRPFGVSLNADWLRPLDAGIVDGIEVFFVREIPRPLRSGTSASLALLAEPRTLFDRRHCTGAIRLFAPLTAPEALSNLGATAFPATREAHGTSHGVIHNITPLSSPLFYGVN